ncbi:MULTISPECIES: tRNA1(Val) (adenine(37)-N6)-methyltransferase [Staphylococcus]|uniref:tRNA1(Val) (adenine(37)-N6)-methyltransferase n=1 Tax=Staphylococcus TaxID=1279 RepID=UPI0008A10F6E|nr:MULTISPECIES: tRNA1(Val) (adenine(37)-N6)-methyltransferase [Staphylococcus]ARB78621.1 tRNA1(Val) (adenine(37)-N6)-methyltransferase [Staphylococcus lugdunensis]ARJ19750.1 SAM-dependent methyltransferase [Staphylococcus lugdunensis]MCH8643392.1 tRNA1(Val) (adenine(37)-N6)-methyltransferase [Staphylococcus lugdunensis]MCH8645724.1 tRNA1(Val) (adenine(37)-N6)-methyltransferase [Staphylococcus lugdunensis]MCH8671852.1 tRNA1(Val) (adenine(37)-N6)-methyltransferase [Staphylococcus lugdunensis]
MLKAHERIDCLIKENLKVIQNDDVFSFSTDALLLGYFTEVRKKDTIMDLCSGNGVIPLLLSAKGTQQIDAMEIQIQLVDMARRSFKYNHLENRLTLFHMDLKETTQYFKPSQYSLVTCNPPYFKINQQHQHQKEAHKIARHEIMCTLSDCMKAAQHLLKQGGRLMMVHRAERLMDVLTEMRQVNIEPKRLHLIYSKKGKTAQTIVVEGRKSGKHGLELCAPFYIYNEDGSYSDEMKEVYYG